MESNFNFHQENRQSNEANNMTFMDFVDKCENKSHASRDTRLVLDTQTLDNACGK